MKHDAKAAVAFLRLLYPEGPWALSAFHPDRKSDKNERSGATFQPAGGGEVDGITSWLIQNAQRNVYYSLNRTAPGRRVKADKTEILAAPFLHVDIDPRARRPDDEEPAESHFAKERARIEKLLRAPPNSIPPPTFLIYSGGGVNALWRLAEEVPLAALGGDEETINARAEEFERYNIGLARHLGGDNCHNVDRILRLPGTVNYPDKKKRERGRVDTLAELVLHDPGRIYQLSDFEAAPKVQSQVPGASGLAAARATGKYRPPGNVVRLSGTEDLGDKVPDLVKAVIVQGHHPHDPAKWKSRSEPLWFVVCQLTQAGIENDVIYSVITDPDFGISKSILDNPDPERYACRQIDRARDFAKPDGDKLLELNDRYAVIGNYGGKCVVVEELHDPVLKRYHLSDQSFQAFRDRHLNVKVKIAEDKEGRAVLKPMGHWWLEHEGRKQYERVVFAPGHEVPNCYNMWQGFAVEPVPGDGHLQYLEHVKKHVCSNDPDLYKYLLGWMATCVQHPDRPGEVAVVLRSEKKGMGKGVFADEFGALFGRHYMMISEPSQLTGNFNLHLKDTVVLFADEAFWAKDRQAEGVLKTLITSRTVAIEAKHVNVETAANFLHLIIASNKDYVVPASADERRYLVLDMATPPDLHQSRKYFGGIIASLCDNNFAGRKNLLYFLLHYDTAGWEPLPVPETQGLRDQKTLSLSTEEEWWLKVLEDAEILPMKGWALSIARDDLVKEYFEYCKNQGITRRANSTTLIQWLRRVVPGLRVTSGECSRTIGHNGSAVQTRPVRTTTIKLLGIKECREAWEKKHGAYDWPEDEVRAPTEQLELKPDITASFIGERNIGEVPDHIMEKHELPPGPTRIVNDDGNCF